MMQLGPYRILRSIGRGGQGHVLLAWDPRLQRQVAIKLYRLPEDRPGRRRALAEARRCATLESARIAQVHDVVAVGRDLAIVMQYVPGCDLRHLLAGARLSTASALAIASDVAAALAAARQRDIIHGDLKAANVLISESGRALLTDFGVASAGVGGRANGVSHSALTPEHLRHEPLGAHSDLFALGTLLYEMLAGFHPFREAAAGPGALLRAEYPPLSAAAAEHALPAALVDLVHAMLAPRPADRPTSIYAVRKVLREVSRELPASSARSLAVEARPFFRPEAALPLPAEIPGDWFRRPRWRTALAWVDRPWRPSPQLLRVGCLALVLAAGVGWSLRGDPRCIDIAPPTLAVTPQTRMPPAVSMQALMRELQETIAHRRERIEFAGAAADPQVPRVLRAGGLAPVCMADDRLELAVRCQGAVCLLEVSNTRRNLRQQRTLFADMAAARWHDAVREMAVALYP